MQYTSPVSSDTVTTSHHVHTLIQNAAKAALELHGRELAPGLPLSVLVSNPERKKDRTDADANNREVYVAGVSKLATRAELENLFATVNISHSPAILG